MSDQLSVLDEAIDDPLTGHIYDGIEEYDNPMPGWWKMIFLGTIAFGFCYWFVATISWNGLSVETAYSYDKTQETIKQFGSLGELQQNSATLLRFSHDDKWNAVGKSIFLNKCAACHGSDGAGINGPNLTDEKYIHIRKLDDFFDVIGNGRNNGAMPAWRNTLSPNEIIMVAAYASSLRGQNKPGKAPEANAQAIDPWPAP